MPAAHQPLAEAERLAYLYRVAGLFSSTLDLTSVLDRVMDEVISATAAERGLVVLRRPDGTLDFAAARGLDQQTLSEPALKVSRGVVERVLANGTPLLTSDAQDEGWLASRRSVMVLGLHSILCVPLLVRGQASGVIYVDNRLQAGIFSPADLDLLCAIATSAAAAIENARLYQLALQQGRMERELQLAREVQAGLLPQQMPHLAGWEFAAAWEPAREVAGDYYDFILLGQGDTERLGVVVGDVSDKGMPAALFMAVARSTLRASLAQGAAPALAISQANHLLCADTTSGMFISLFYGQLDPLTGEFVYVNAGHNPPLWLQAASGTLQELESSGPILAAFDDAAYREHRLHLAAGDLLLLYTDGLTEAPDAARREFGLERVHTILQQLSSRPAAEITAALLEAVRAYSGSVPFDDITLVLLKRSKEDI